MRRVGGRGVGEGRTHHDGGDARGAAQQGGAWSRGAGGAQVHGAAPERNARRAGGARVQAAAHDAGGEVRARGEGTRRCVSAARVGA